MIIGLFFFIRASVKDRTQKVVLNVPIPEDTCLSQLKTYFEKRAYQVTASNTLEKQITLEGFVRPSLFLALFLSCLAALGLSCLALVLSLLYPNSQGIFFLLVLLTPLTGLFYWKKAGRVEKISLKVESNSEGQTQMTIIAHRDELIELEQQMVQVKN